MATDLCICAKSLLSGSGESNLKIKRPIDLGPATPQTPEDVLRLKGELHCEPPNANLHIFVGRLEVASSVLDTDGESLCCAPDITCAAAVIVLANLLLFLHIMHCCSQALTLLQYACGADAKASWCSDFALQLAAAYRPYQNMCFPRCLQVASPQSSLSASMRCSCVGALSRTLVVSLGWSFTQALSPAFR